ncbi:MAG: hypothetical protein AB7F66_04650 [Bacteriovoracia bacterium]
MKSQIDLEAAGKFLDVLSGGQEALWVFETFDESPKGGQRSPDLRRSFYGSFHEHVDSLANLNARGAGIFFTVNKTRAARRRSSDVVSVRAVFADGDDGDIKVQIPLQPSITVRSKRGQHFYWLTHGLELQAFGKIQKQISRQLGTDPKVNDLSRLMRLPGFFHNKDTSNPYLVTVEQITDRKYSCSQLIAAFSGGVRKAGTDEFAYVLNDFGAFACWTDNLPLHSGGRNRFGGRNNTLLLVAREGLALGVPHAEIKRAMRSYANRSGETETNLGEMLDKQIRCHHENPFRPYFVLSQNEQTTAVDIAERYLLTRGLFDPSGHRISNPSSLQLDPSICYCFQRVKQTRSRPGRGYKNFGAYCQRSRSRVRIPELWGNDG